VIERDRLRRFLFEDAPIRGHWVRLAESWRDAREHQNLAAPVAALLGESLAATSLLAASLKFSGTLTLQLAGSTGRVSMLIAQCTDARALRGVAHLAGATTTTSEQFGDLIRGGRLAVTVEQGAGLSPWQGVIPLQGANLAQCLEGYFQASEQVPTALVLAADMHHAAGLLLQKLPTADKQGESAAAQAQEVWEEAVALLATLSGDELLSLEPQVLLTRLFGSRDLRLFDGEPVRFGCRCDRARVAGMLVGLGREEVESILAEQGVVTVTCEFCQRPYRFDSVDARQLFMDRASVGLAPTMN
jgi:molecular chaperone Hsp33